VGLCEAEVSEKICGNVERRDGDLEATEGTKKGGVRWISSRGMFYQAVENVPIGDTGTGSSRSWTGVDPLLT
jgi:hypothetical protein